MAKQFNELLRDVLLRTGNNNKTIRIAIFTAIVLPVVLIAAFAYFSTYQDLTEFTLLRRQSIADLAATVLEQKLDRLTDIGVSLATRVRFRQLVSEEKWDEAIAILHGVSKDFPIIERIFLADPSGTLMADAPALAAVRGKNFANRDWYQGVSSAWKPYISGVYQRAAEPRYNVIATAIPIKAEKEKTVGILVLQVRLDTLVDWSKSIKVGGAGFVYVVDKEGRLAAHPKVPLQRDIHDYSSVPVVQKVLRGQNGVEISFNPLEKEERVAAYASVPGSGWGVIATEPTRTAFEKRDEDLKALLVRYGLIFLMSCILAYAVLCAVSAREQAEAERQRFENY